MQRTWNRLSTRSIETPSFFARSRSGVTLIEVLMVLMLISILITFFAPVVERSREVARRTQCRDNLRRIGVAFQLHETQLGHLPSNGWGSRWHGVANQETGIDQPGGWLYQCTDYLDLGHVRRLGLATDPIVNEQELKLLLSINVPVFNCPSRPWSRSGYLKERTYNPTKTRTPKSGGKTDYAVNKGDQTVYTTPGPTPPVNPATHTWSDGSGRVSTGISFVRSQIRMSDLKDGATHTLAVGEKVVHPDYYRKGGRGPDWSGMVQLEEEFFNDPMFVGEGVDNARTTSGPPAWDRDPTSQTGFGSAHKEGCHYLFCDGSVRTVNYNIDETLHASFGNRADGQVLEAQ